MKRQLRNLQTFSPFIRPAKFRAYNTAARYLGLHIQSGFRVLASSVPVETLDSFDLAPDFVKIDVCDVALAVVKDGMKTFRRNQPLPIIERPGRELGALPDSMGPKAYCFHKGRLDTAWNQAFNRVFLTDKHRTGMGL